MFEFRRESNTTTASRVGWPRLPGRRTRTRARRFRVALLAVGLVALGTVSTVVAQGPTPAGFNFQVVADAASDGLGGRPAFAFDNTNFLMVWLDASANIRAARISTAGTVLDSGGFVVGTASWRPSVAFDGTNYLIIWVSGSEVWGAFVTPAGAVVTGSPFAITTGANVKTRDLPIVFGADHYLVAWRTNSDQLYAARVSTAGVNLDPAGILFGSGFYPWIAYDGTNYLIVWYKWGNGLDIHGNRLAADGTVLNGSGFSIFGGAGDQAHPSVAFGGTDYLVVWYDTSDGSGGNDADARGVRVSTAGTVLDSPEILISPYVHSEVPVNVVFDGTDFFVVWHQELSPANFRLTDVYGTRVSVAGVVLDEPPVPATTAFGHQFGPRMGYGGGHYLIAWNESVGRCDWCLRAQLLTKPTKASADAAAPPPGYDPRAGVAAVAWDVQASISTDAVHDVWGFDDGTALAVGNAAFLYTYDGAAWSSLSYPDPHGAYGIYARSPSDVWITGWCYHLKHYDGVTLDDQMSCLNFPEPGLAYSGWALDAVQLLTVGAPGDAKNVDINWCWTAVDQDVPVELFDTWGAPSGPIYAVGEHGSVLTYGAAGWTSVAGIPTGQCLNSIWGHSSDSVFVVGDHGTIVHFDGDSWTQQDSGTREHLFGVWGDQSGVPYAVGASGTILRYDGAVWRAETSATDLALLSVTRAGDFMLAVGEEGVVRSRLLELFADGFEVGDTSAWSATIP